MPIGLDFIKVLLVAFTSLFPVVNPIGCAPIFFGLTKQYPQSAQRILARKIAGYSFAFASCFIAIRYNDPELLRS